MLKTRPTRGVTIARPAEVPNAQPTMTKHAVDVDRYRVPEEGVALSAMDPADTQGFKESDEVKERFHENRERIGQLQEMLFAEGRQALLLVLQAMDTGGKDGSISAVTEGINPQGCRVVPFKVPCVHELAHDFLWRVHAQLPSKGTMTIFNRSHYEDVLVVRVHQLAPVELVEKRYGHITDFERLVSDHGTRIIKVMLHISKAYQADRLRLRLERPNKQWKFNPDDLEERKLWDEYMAAYELAVSRTSRAWAPWYVVPAENKWWRNLVVSEILRRALEDMDPQYPPAKFDRKLFTPESIV